MSRRKKTVEELQPKRQTPAFTTEARENQLISLATDVAEKQLREGTASAQVITHYLKLATVKAKLELETMAMQKDLVEAKISAIKSQQHMEELYQEALNAMKRYGGSNEDSDVY